MPGDTGARAGTVSSSNNPMDNVRDLYGTAANPGRDPKATGQPKAGTIGSRSLNYALMIVIAAWVVVLLLAYSLRHHNR